MKRIRRLVRSMTVVVSALAIGHVEAQETGQSEKGLAFAQRVCAECHAIDKKQLRSPNAAAPRFEAIANVTGMTGIALTVALQTSHRSMPNLILDAGELRNIVAYILSLK
jgi:mono/diheme cytochrome c family protein